MTAPGNSVAIELFTDARSELLPFFLEADDSPTEIAAYFELGEVFVARIRGNVVAHVQIIASSAGDCEIKSLAVIEAHRQKGIGAALVRFALKQAFSNGASRVVVATASSDIGNLRFYQRLGFRMERIERDVFTIERGYPRMDVDGIPLRDRVWLSVLKSCRM